MRKTRLLAMVLAVAMVASVFAPLGTVAADEDGNSDGLSIDVEQNGEVLVTVTANDSAVENATLEVSTVDEDATYEGAKNYTTDEDGTVALPAPNETVEVKLEVAYGDETASTEVTLDGDDEEEDEAMPFGHLVSQFVEDTRNDTDGPLGLAVASFVTENNPGNAPDHAGPPAHAGPGGDDDERGPPAHAGPGGDDDDERGPPAHAGPGDDETDEDDADDGDEADEDDEDDEEEADEDDEDDEEEADEDDEDDEEEADEDE